MNTWSIKVLYLGKGTLNLSSIWPAGMPPLPNDYLMSFPYLGFLLQSKGRNILIDTGISEKFIVNGKAWGGFPAEGGRAYLEKALADAGIDAKQVDTIVYTHLHNDHAANCKLFENARIIFQRDEWANLLNPLPVQLLRRDYDLDQIQEFKSVNCIMVDGDFDLTDGIKIYKTPGHTLGSQSVAVNTRKGVVVFVGDISLVNFMMFPGTKEIMDMEGKMHSIPSGPSTFGPAIPHSIIYDFYKFYESIYKIKAIATQDKAGYIIPAHEPSLVATGI